MSTPAAAAANWPRTTSERLGVLSMGVIAGLDGVTFSVAIASLMFTGPLSSGLGLGASATLLCTVVVALALGVRSQLATNVAHVQDIGVAVLATTLAAMATDMSGTTEEKIATAFAVVGLSSILTGLLLWLTGRFGLGRIVKFFPQPVLAGFLAGTGWLLIKGGVSLSVGFSPALDDLGELVSGDSLRLLLPAVVAAVAIYVAMSLRSHPVTLLAILWLGLAGFFIWLALIGKSLEWSRSEGYVPDPPGNAALDLPFPDLFDAVRWSEVFALAPTIASVAVVCLFAALLNTSALERVVGRDIDMDHELRTTGVANVVVGLFGAAPGYNGVSISLLAHKAGVRTKGVGVITAVIVLGGFLFASQIVAHVPNFLPACLVIYLGADLIGDWVVRTARTYSLPEWLTVLAIVAVVAFSGFFTAMVVGLLISTVLFVYSYARIPVLRYSTTLAGMPSTTGRSAEETSTLQLRGRGVEILRLQGFLFFGTADQVVGYVRDRLHDVDKGPLTALVLDFTHVSNIDSASAASIHRVMSLGAANRFDVLLSAANESVLAALGRGSVNLLATDGVITFATLDLALEAAESRVLADRTTGAGIDGPVDPMHALVVGLPDADRLESLTAHMVRSRHADGELILTAGGAPDALLFIESGSVAVMRPNLLGTPERLRVMAAGSVVGDIGLGLGVARTADIVAEGPATVLTLSGAQIAELERSEPELAFLLHRIISRALAEKVITANRMTDHVKA